MSERNVAYVDSAEEQLAYLMSRFGTQERWSVVEQRLATGVDGSSVERTTLHTAHGAIEVEFRDAHPPEVLINGRVDQERSSRIELVMERALIFAAENPPHHPGSLPRFPVPIEHYERAVAVPMPILAVDDAGRRGLFSPPRMAVMSWETFEPVGVRDFQDFDPGSWPPQRLGDWPTRSTEAMPTEVLEASIQRFGACWSRIIEAWFERSAERFDAVASLPSDIDDALALRRKLDLVEMNDVYESMNPAFARWLHVNHS